MRLSVLGGDSWLTEQLWIIGLLAMAHSLMKHSNVERVINTGPAWERRVINTEKAVQSKKIPRRQYSRRKYREGSTVENSAEKEVQWRTVQRRQYSGEKYREGSTVEDSTEKAAQWRTVQRRQYSGEQCREGSTVEKSTEQPERREKKNGRKYYY